MRCLSAASKCIWIVCIVDYNALSQWEIATAFYTPIKMRVRAIDIFIKYFKELPQIACPCPCSHNTFIIGILNVTVPHLFFFCVALTDTFLAKFRSSACALWKHHWSNVLTIVEMSFVHFVLQIEVLVANNGWSSIVYRTMTTKDRTQPHGRSTRNEWKRAQQKNAGKNATTTLQLDY